MRFGIIVALMVLVSVFGVLAVESGSAGSGMGGRERFYDSQRPVSPETGQEVRSGTLIDTAVLLQTFADASGPAPMSADSDGNFHYSVSGGNAPFGNLFARYLLNGTLDITADLGIDFRSLVTDNIGNLFAKEYGIPGNFYSITSDGVPTLLFAIADSNYQTSAAFNGDDSELYTMTVGTINRYDSATGAALGNFSLVGMTAGELSYPDNIQMETTPSGRILTYSDGIVSEWDLGGNRIGQCSVPIATPTDFHTEFSFGVGGTGMVYLYNATSLEWEIYDVGAEVPVELMSFSVE